MRVSQSHLSIAIAAVIAFSCVGCSTFSSKSAKDDRSLVERLPLIGKKKKEEPEPYPNPIKMAATWTPDTLVQTGRTPTRGFGGRVFFYDEKSRAVPVEGTLVVHGFDDTAEPEHRVKRFEFTPEQFTRHFSQTDLGASYSIWIPWDAIGGQQRRISLVTSFRTTEGKMVQGIPATVLLPGAAVEADAPEELAKLSPQYRKYREATESPKPSSGLTTTTIARRRTTPQTDAEQDRPGIAIPSGSADAIVAATAGTPAGDVPMIKKPAPLGRSTSTVMPASAELPIQR